LPSITMAMCLGTRAASIPLVTVGHANAPTWGTPSPDACYVVVSVPSIPASRCPGIVQ